MSRAKIVLCYTFFGSLVGGLVFAVPMALFGTKASVMTSLLILEISFFVGAFPALLCGLYMTKDMTEKKAILPQKKSVSLFKYLTLAFCASAAIPIIIGSIFSNDFSIESSSSLIASLGFIGLFVALLFYFVFGMKENKPGSQNITAQGS